MHPVDAILISAQGSRYKGVSETDSFRYVFFISITAIHTEAWCGAGETVRM